MKSASEMTDREWRHAVEQQRHRVDELEEEKGRRKKQLSEVTAELKGARASLDRLIRGEEDPEDDDPTPALPFPAGEPLDGKRAAAGEREEVDDDDGAADQARVDEVSARRRAAKAKGKKR